jgi:polar amino acid transport system substrate-binding protein
MRWINFGKMAIIAIVFSSLLFNTAESAETLDIGSVYRPPLSNQEGTGLVDVIVKEAFSRIGIKIQIVPTDRKQALEKANKGLYDGDLMRVDGASQRYPNLIQIPETFYDFDFVAFSKNLNVPMTGWEGLKPYRVGIPEGSVELSKNVTEQNTKSVLKFASPFDMFNSLRKGEADLVIYERLMGYEEIREVGMSDIHALEPSFSKQQMFLYLHKKHQDLVPKVAAALSDMKKDGTIQKLTSETLGKYKK